MWHWAKYCLLEIKYAIITLNLSKIQYDELILSNLLKMENHSLVF